MPRLTDIPEKNAAPNANFQLHVVDPDDNTDNEAGSSFRMTVANLVGGFIASLGLYFNKADDTADDITEGTTNLFMTEAERTKLTGVAAGATQNATDAELRARATHTGTQPASTISDFAGAADARVAAGIASHGAETDPHTQYQKEEEKGVAGGYASLDGTGKVPASQLPSFVDDVVEAADLASLPVTGETGKIYVTLNDNKTFRWSGSAYVEISASPGSTDAVTEGAGNLYFTATRVRETVLTGLSVASSAIVAATDTVLVAFGKLQAQITALTTVVDGKADSAHGHVIDDVTGLQTALDGKAATSHSHVIGDVTDLQTALDVRLTFNVTTEASSATPTATGDRKRNHHFVTALAANTVLQVPTGTPAQGNMAKYSILNGGTIRTCDKHASLLDPYAKFTAAISIPANGRLDALLEHNGTAWVVLEAVATV